MSTNKIPIVDLSAFTDHNGDVAARNQTAADLDSKLRLNGWVGVSGHGVTKQRLEQAFSVAKKFFDLSHDEKMTAPHPDGAVPHRGYSAVGREQASLLSAQNSSKATLKELQALLVKDHKETFEVGSEENRTQYNIWPPENVAPGFKQFTLDFYWELNKLALAFLDAVAIGLGLTEQEAQKFRNLYSGYENQLRLLHYPPTDAEYLKQNNSTRLFPHSDFPLFTMLFQDEVGGLEFHDRDSDSYVAATPMEGIVYVNVDDMLNRYTNGIYPSALHRVVPPAGTTGGTFPERFSIGYFVEPLPDVAMGPFPSLIASSPDGARFEPITFDDFKKAKFEAVRVSSG